MCHPTDVRSLLSTIIGRVEKQPSREKVLIKNKNSTQPNPDPATVLVIHEDPVIGQALTLLLEGASYRVRSVTRPSLQGSFDELILPTLAAEEVRLVILAFDMNAEYSGKTLEFLENKPFTPHVPIMVLGSPVHSSEFKAVYFVPWPIRTKELKRQIETILAVSQQGS